jgi:hypothetical protein
METFALLSSEMPAPIGKRLACAAQDEVPVMRRAQCAQSPATTPWQGR